jgi:Ca-activated chloride channel family protein
MKFIWPAMLLFLLLVPVFVYWYIQIQLRRRKFATRYGSLGTMQGAIQNRLGVRRHIPPVIFLVALIILIVALARPETTVSLPRIQGTVILAFDVSGSMAADDLKPTRMEAAKTAVQSFIERQSPSVQIGVVAFSDSGLSVQVPTNDQGELLSAIGRLTAQRGTSLANGILASLTTIEAGNGAPTNYYSNQTPTPEPTPTPMPSGTYSSSVIVLLTDGENNQNPDPLEVAQVAADRGVRIYTVGIGSPAGADLHIDGFTIHTQLDEAMLQQISQITGGTYYNAENEEDLLTIYDNLNPTLMVKPEEMEVTSILAGISILFLLIGGTISLLWFGRVP